MKSPDLVYGVSRTPNRSGLFSLLFPYYAWVRWPLSSGGAHTSDSPRPLRCWAMSRAKRKAQRIHQANPICRERVGNPPSILGPADAAQQDAYETGGRDVRPLGRGWSL